MGKGGCTKPPASSSLGNETVTASTLEKERSLKINASPQFTWSHSEEPHKKRKAEILSKHPSVKSYMGIDPSTKYKVAFWVAVQLLSLHLLQGASVYTWMFCCYTLSGSINHMMTLAMHELSHNLGARGMFKNRVLAILANLPMGIPAAMSFKRECVILVFRRVSLFDLLVSYTLHFIHYIYSAHYI